MDSVFVVHGRNEPARLAVFDLLRAFGLNPLEWDELIAATGDAAPYIGDVLSEGFRLAKAAVVVMTPDDEARLRPDYWRESDGSGERQLTGQPRQNVTLEAGMALTSHPKRTVILEVGHIRGMSDILGRHVLRIRDSVDSRRQFWTRLKTAGCNCAWTTDCETIGDLAAAVNASVPATTTNQIVTADILLLGKYANYFANLHAGLTFERIENDLQGFFEALERCGFSQTRAIAETLSNHSIKYDRATHVIRPASLNEIQAMFKGVSASLTNEVARLRTER